ncbi:MAG: peptidoglycan-binding protein [Trebonia sp.]|uniref:peptidoglycan-binding domain-containing protein n=1 Tax=Trebonia sp. TaxID=2767075 RepID=UPI003C734AFD
MSTQFDTQHTHTDDTHAYGQPTASRRAPRHGGNGPSGYRIAAIVIGTVIAAALIVLAAVGLTHITSTSTPAPAASTSVPAANPAQPTSPAQNVNPAQPTTPAVTPSASVKKLQQELGQLNYYEGPVDGLMGPQTVAAIRDLQRQAGLPQTGTMNAATQKALDNYLAHGNNQMGGNS